MILRFMTLDGIHALNVNFDRECYNFGTTPDRNYISVNDTGFSDILKEIDFNEYAYSETLETNDPANFHPFIERKKGGRI